MSKITKIYSVYTNEVLELKSIFEKSILDDWEVKIEFLGEVGTGHSNFGSSGWYEIIKAKIVFLIAKIEENIGDIIIWSDLDIKFYAKCSDLIYAALANNDIVFQAEHWPERQVNTGFAAIKCNEATLSLYKHVLNSELEKMPFADQSAVNQILTEEKVDLKWDVLPRQFWATSHFMYDSLMPPKDIVLHHANCTAPTVIDGEMVGSVQLKLKQLKIISNHLSQQDG
jgi:hypothetical protein